MAANLDELVNMQGSYRGVFAKSNEVKLDEVFAALAD
jgi:roadblock/LC7 domain-containing protein